jgi:protease-4
MKKFLVALVRWFFALLIASILLVSLGLYLIGRIAQSAAPAPLEVQEKTILVVDLGLNLIDSPVSEDLADLIAAELQNQDQRDLQLRRALDAIDRAAADANIVGILLTGDFQGAGYGNSMAALRDFRSRLADFRSAGKPIWAFLENDGLGAYYVKSVADEVWMAPAHALTFLGLGSEMIYWGGTFDRFGIDVEVVRAGKYKSFAETYSESEMSPENREQLSVLLGSLWTSIREDVADSRELTLEELQAVSDELGLVLDGEALSRGLVDEVLDESELVDRLAAAGTIAGEGRGFRQVGFVDYVNQPQLDLIELLDTQKDEIAIVYAEGAIVDGMGEEDQVGGDRIAGILRDLRFDDSVKAVVLRVNSPGGSASASEKIAREVDLLNEEKPVVVSMGGYAASGGYYISALADTIYAEPTTITGSIGVIAMLPDIEGLANNYEVNIERVTTSDQAGLLSPLRGRSPEQIQRIENFVMTTYDTFLSRVSEGRNLARDLVEEVAQGRVWTGVDAQSRGLVDRLGGLEDAIAFAADRAGLGDAYSLIERPKARTLEESLREIFQGGAILPTDLKTRLATEAVADDSTRRVLEEWRWLQVMNDPRHLYAYSPVRVFW